MIGGNCVGERRLGSEKAARVSFEDRDSSDQICLTPQLVILWSGMWVS